MGDYKGCIICDLNRSHGNRPHAYKEVEANAKLISAAPELLEACKLIVDNWALIDETTLNMWDIKEVLDKAIKKAIY